MFLNKQVRSQPMERQSEGPTLLDGWMVDLGGPKTKAMLDRLDQTIHRSLSIQA